MAAGLLSAVCCLPAPRNSLAAIYKMGASTPLQVGLLNYHLSQVRTGGNLLGAFLALYNFAGGFGRPVDRLLARGVSVLAFLAAAWLLWCGAREYRTMVNDSRGHIPEDRVRSMLAWTYLSHGMAAAAVCVALFGVAHAAASR